MKNLSAAQLRNHLEDTYGLERQWPKVILVDAETYANVCQVLFQWSWDHRDIQHMKDGGRSVEFHLGANKHPMYKGVEVICQTEST